MMIIYIYICKNLLRIIHVPVGIVTFSSVSDLVDKKFVNILIVVLVVNRNASSLLVDARAGINILKQM